MQGRIWVISEAGKGSAFYFTASFEAAEHEQNVPPDSYVTQNAL
jgi:signal transduction histidine kinase